MEGMWRRRFTGFALGIGLAAPAGVLAAGQGAMVPVQAGQEPTDRFAPNGGAQWPQFESLDSTGDGFVTQQDLDAAGINLRDEQFAEVDVNQDRRLDPVEYQLAQGMFAGEVTVGVSESMRNGAGGTLAEEGGAANPLLDQRVSTLEGQIVNGIDGERIGQVSRIVIDQDSNQPHAVVSMGGILGFGSRQAAIPLQRLRMDQDDQLTASLSGDAQALSEQFPFDEQRFRAVEGDRTVAELSSGGAARDLSGELGTFQELDRDGDGFLSRDELAQDDGLGDRWDQFDTNRDDQLDRSEFSRFEGQQPGTDMSPDAGMGEGSSLSQEAPMGDGPSPGGPAAGGGGPAGGATP